MAEPTRTFMCSVLFLDIVEYSQRVVSEQIRLKDRFNAVLTEAIAGVPTDERIILDTGDGAAVNFLGDPEDAMFAGLSLRDSVAGQDLTGGPKLQVRIGINIGPVKLVKDINGQPNIIGDGINVAQRVMNFAERGQILVSRDYYNVMVRLSEDYAQLFHYEGAKTDKHVREHEVYAISAAPSTLRRSTPLPAPKPARRLPNLTLSTLKLPVQWVTGIKLRPLASKLAVNSKLLVAAPLAFILIVSSGVIARGHRNSPGEDRVAAQAGYVASRGDSPALSVAASANPVPPAPGGTLLPESQNIPSRAEYAPAAMPRAEAPAPKPARPVAKAPSANAKVAEAAQAERTKVPAPAARAELPRDGENQVALLRPSVDPAVNIVIVAFPWAEVYVDGNRLGVSPPLRSVPLKPGRHKVELRNSSFPAHVETVDVKAGAEIAVRHRFRR